MRKTIILLAADTYFTTWVVHQGLTHIVVRGNQPNTNEEKNTEYVHGNLDQHGRKLYDERMWS